MWRRHGHPRARRQPGSGSWRPYGAGDVPPRPGDIAGVPGWLQEVKWDQRAQTPARGTRYAGGRFIRETLADLEALWLRIRAVDDAGHLTPEPVLWVRGQGRRGREEDAWRVLVRAEYFGRRMGGWSLREIGAWVEVPAWLFFAELADPR